MQRGLTNGVKDMRILSRTEALEMEPNLADSVYAALLVPSGGIVCPFGLNIALAENAAANGVAFRLETEVLSIEKLPETDAAARGWSGRLCTKSAAKASGRRPQMNRIAIFALASAMRCSS